MRTIRQPNAAVVFTLALVCVGFLVSSSNVQAHAGHDHSVVDLTPTSTSEALAVSSDEISSSSEEPLIPDEVAVSTSSPAPSPYSVEILPNQSVFNDFVVGPGKFELEIAPGQSKTVELMVTNRMGATKRFKFEVEDMTGSDDGSSAVMLLGSTEGPYTLRDFVSVPAMEFELAHGSRARIPVTISLPANADPGGRYGSLVVSTVARDADPNPDGNALPSSAIVSRIGTLFFITTPGDIERAGELSSFDVKSGKKFFSNGPIDFMIAYENKGSVHVNPYGELRIRNMFGDEVGFVKLDPWFALPQSLRTREVSWNRELLIGRYTATLSLNRGYDDSIDEASVTFYVIPWKLVAMVFAVLFILFFTLRLVFSRFEVKRKG